MQLVERRTATVAGSANQKPFKALILENEGKRLSNNNTLLSLVKWAF